MTSTATELSLAELARYLDRPVQYEKYDTLSGRWETKKDVLTVSFFAFLVTNSWHSYRNIRPILRPLSSVTAEEAKECFRLAFPQDAYPPVGDIEAHIDTIITIFDMTKRIVICDRCIVANSRNTGKAWECNATAVIDYLDSLGVDIRGMLQKGLAVEETV